MWPARIQGAGARQFGAFCHRSSGPAAMNGAPLKIGITCYPTFGGSGIIATEIGLSLARRGHRVHFICYDVPSRLDGFLENIFFHEVEELDYPLFDHGHYALALASKMVEVSTYE